MKANFGKETDAGGTIYGTIHNIVAGGVLESGVVIHLNDADLGQAHINEGAFNGSTRMGTGTIGTDGMATYPYNGTWTGSFYNSAENDTDTDVNEANKVAPGSVAGTFGVTMPDKAATTDVNERTSYLGAFGAHKSSQ